MSKKKMKGRVKWSFCFPLEGGGRKRFYYSLALFNYIFSIYEKNIYIRQKFR